MKAKTHWLTDWLIELSSWSWHIKHGYWSVTVRSVKQNKFLQSQDGGWAVESGKGGGGEGQGHRPK